MRLSVRGLGQLARPLSPAYIVHSRVETVEADVQGYNWTGCRVVEGRPAAVVERERQVDVDLFSRDVARNIIVSRNFESQEAERIPQSYATSLSHHLLRTLFWHAPALPQLRALHLALRVPVSGTWERGGAKVSVRGQPGDMLLSRNPLPPIFSAEEVASASTVAMPTRGLFSDLNQWEVREVEEGEGEGEDVRQSCFPHLHTLWLVDSEATAEVQLLQRGLLFTFGRLVQQAVAVHGRQVVGHALPQPLSGQCVVTNGKRFSFVWVQLNTLALGGETEGEEEGEGEGWNVACVERPGLLYSGVAMVGGRRKRRVLDLREDILRTLLGTILMH